jgi:hypothetical protein
MLTQGLTFANNPNVLLNVKFNETCPFPIGVARGPLSATVFFLTEAMASAGMAVLPLTKVGVTSTSSHWIGALAALKMDLTDSAISGPIPSPGIRVTV